jgi:Uma2 family endonuclease
MNDVEPNPGASSTTTTEECPPKTFSVYVVERIDLPQPPGDLVAEDGENLESDWHRIAINLLINVLAWLFRDRQDFYCGGNMFIYFDKEGAKHKNFRGPDFFFVWDVQRSPVREYWAVWNEGKMPDVIIELTSPTTKELDYGTKKDTYEKRLKTSEYYCYDPTNEQLDGWRLVDRKYVAIEPDANGRLECRTLGLWLGKWTGEHEGFTTTWLRWFDAQGELVPTGREAETQRAEEEHQRAEAALTEVARLKAQLAAQKANGPTA